MASGQPEYVIDTELRWLRQYTKGRVFVAPEDEAATTWLTELSAFGGQLNEPVALLLLETPEWAANVLRSW
jgi:hypothetical protein